MSEGHPSVGIVIPTYNRSDTLKRTLASLEPQTWPATQLHVVIADDGSEEDIELLTELWETQFLKTYVRQERRGFGAARARNLGASALNDSEIVIFLDSDGLVAPDFVKRHATHHRDQFPRVVIGGRVHLKASSVEIGDLRDGSASLEDLPVERDSDFRHVLARRTSGYTATDEGYRAFVSSNVSLPLALHRQLGGFEERFRWWGSEDTEYGWRLWQTGVEFVDESGNAIYHQTDSDTAGGAKGRQRARERNRGLLISRVPQRFYRKSLPDPLPEVPKVSVVLTDTSPGSPEAWWFELSRQSLADFELILVSEPEPHDPFAGAAEGERRIAFYPDLAEALTVACGEYVVISHAAAAPSRTFIQNIAKRLDQRPAAVSLTFGIDVPDVGPFGLIEDIKSLSRDWNHERPIAIAVRNRWIMQQLLRGSNVDDVLNYALANAIHTRQPLIALPATSSVPRPASFSIERRATRLVIEHGRTGGPGQGLRAGLHLVKEKRRRKASSSAKGQDSQGGRSPVGVRYIGWVGKDNLGDEVMLDASRLLMPWGDVTTRGEALDLLLLGGGTLINRNQYLRWLTERDSPRLERAVVGTGVASEDYWGTTEDPDEWKRWLGTCVYAGVRGPHSLATLERWGAAKGVEICGDLALALKPPEVKTIEGRVLIAPAATGGQLWGESDDDVFDALAKVVIALVDQGREVVLLSCHPTDDRPILRIREQLGDRPTTYIAGYQDVTMSFSQIASAEVVIGERLHACVLAAAASRPFVALEYRPKVRDFAASVAMESQVIRTDELEHQAIVERVVSLNQPTREMVESVTTYRSKLVAAADTIRKALEA